ncbi:MAG TPA: lipopolysaccharide biosynthesis protein [Ignavibacteriaceae bacterium]|nr:lipopolysaccharide biosynthesis protein [Ignavibacteriaceae bacterium]
MKKTSADSNSSLKTKATQGILWSSIDKFAVQGGQFVIGVVLARLLMPEDFGLIGMLSILLAISQIFIESGMGTGLIQKKNRSEIDYSTVFVFNFIVSLLFYVIFFLSAPLVAAFYNVPQLTGITQVLTLNIVINSFSIIQRAKLTINIDFKSIAKINVFSTILSGCLGVVLALLGFGVWALVIKNLLASVISSCMFIYLSKWKLSVRFSMNSFRELFGFGYKLLIAGLYSQTLSNIYNVVIGKTYSAADLGFYDKARNFVVMSEGTVTSILFQVTYPILASVQDDKSRMVEIYRRIIKMTAYFTVPALTLLSLLADPFIRVILTDKWIVAVPFLQLLCFSRMFYPISVINMNILNAIGRSDLFLKVDLSKLPMIVLALIITIPLGIKAMVVGQIVTSFISFFINAYLPGKYFGYGAFSQLRDLRSIIISTLLMAGCIYLLNNIFESSFLKLILGTTAGFSLYFIISRLLKVEEAKEVIGLLSVFKRNN